MAEICSRGRIILRLCLGGRPEPLRPDRATSVGEYTHPNYSMSVAGTFGNIWRKSSDCAIRSAVFAGM